MPPNLQLHQVQYPYSRIAGPFRPSFAAMLAPTKLSVARCVSSMTANRRGSSVPPPNADLRGLGAMANRKSVSGRCGRNACSVLLREYVAQAHECGLARSRSHHAQTPHQANSRGAPTGKTAARAARSKAARRLSPARRDARRPRSGRRKKDLARRPRPFTRALDAMLSVSATPAFVTVWSRGSE